MFNKYDVIVVGAGHAGCEAACAAANLGSKTLLITMDLTKVAQMSCNPAIGGIAKGQIVREIDALGGYMGIMTDKSTIQFRMLNKSKGPAMWSPRAQCDRYKYSYNWRLLLEQTNGLNLLQGVVTKLIISKDTVSGVIVNNDVKFFGKSVILTNGTFLNGLIHIGKINFEGGRISEQSSKGLTEQLQKLDFEIGRLKTGTPARLDGRYINFNKMIEQKGDEESNKFSFLNDDFIPLKQRSCYITYTNNKVHEILKGGFKDSPLFKGIIKGRGPRYCPSIEDKIVTFPEKHCHQLFIEPEGENTCEYYINGFSSSLPWNVQYNALLKIPGLENIEIFRPGYAIEYDYFPPTQLLASLETKKVKYLYFAGQINGTTGYEEAAAQGIIAGINAHLKINGKEPFLLNRNQAYIGVLIDDLITKGIDEPYRMFTSRAEYRILLRQDNADIRLTELGHKIGLVNKNRFNIFLNKIKQIKELKNYIFKFSISPEIINSFLILENSSLINQKSKLFNILLRPEIKLKKLVAFLQSSNNFLNSFIEMNEIIDCVEIDIKYNGYLKRESQVADKVNRLEYLLLPEEINYDGLNSLSTEAKQKLNKIRPKSIGQARRIPGISPSDINILLVILGR